jgi:hypothetical protein
MQLKTRSHELEITYSDRYRNIKYENILTIKCYDIGRVWLNYANKSIARNF